MDKLKLDGEFISQEIITICDNLGKIDDQDGRYMKDRDCKSCLREIFRFLNADQSEHHARVTLGSLNIVKSDLIPLIVQYCDYNEGDPEMFTIILRLITNLTSPISILFENKNRDEVTDDAADLTEQIKLENKLLDGLYSYKKAFADDDKIWASLNVHLRHNTDDEVTFERLIILIRNILHIPVDATSDMGVPCDFDAHEMCLYRMDKSGIMSTIIEIATESRKGVEFCLHLTEIIYLMLRDQNPHTLASAKPNALKRKLDESDVDKRRLAELSERNRRERENRSRFGANANRTRYSQFVISNCRTAAGAPLPVRQIIDSRDSIKFDTGKTELRKSKNRKPLSSETSMSRSDLSTKITKVSYSLKVFCKRFVEKVYNNFMQQIKHNLIQKRLQQNDETYYLWSIQFFTQFCTFMSMSHELVSETVSTSTLHFIQVLISDYQDKIKMEKKKFHDISRRLHMALRAFKEILALIKSNEKYHSMLNNIFEKDYSTVLLNLFKEYYEPKHSQHYIKDLIEANDILLDLSEIHFKANDFAARYYSPDIVCIYNDVLRTYADNAASTNTAILKFFQRLIDCNSEIILFQASLFKTLIEIMDYHSPFAGKKDFEELGAKLMASFGAKANKRRWMFQELLFWKSSNDVVEIENAIDPPAVVPVEPPVNEEVDEACLVAELDAAAAEQPLETVEDLMAELGDSDDDDDGDDDDNGNDDKQSNSSKSIGSDWDPLPEDDDDDDGDGGASGGGGGGGDGKAQEKREESLVAAVDGATGEDNDDDESDWDPKPREEEERQQEIAGSPNNDSSSSGSS